MHRLIVAERRWLSEAQFLNALSFCMLLPGPEAMQLATYAGWRIHGVLGGLVAGLLEPQLTAQTLRKFCPVLVGLIVLVESISFALLDKNHNHRLGGFQAPKNTFPELTAHIY